MNIIKKVLAAAVLLAALLSLLSCNSATGGNYSVEEVTGVVLADSDTFAMLSEMLGMLTFDSAEIPDFDNMKDAIGLFRDSVLNYMSGTSYAKYAGNSALIEKVNEKYPGLNVIEVIPADDFESVMYRYFGGSVKITHASGRIFRYLDAADAYIPVTAPINGGVDMTLKEVLETENTYRLTFTCSTDESVTEYYALVIKRDDGSCYFNALVKK